MAHPTPLIAHPTPPRLQPPALGAASVVACPPAPPGGDPNRRPDAGEFALDWELRIPGEDER